MNRSNVGNITTNAVQVMAVSGINAKRFLGRQDKTLNNNQNKPSLTEEQQREYDQMRVDKKLEQVEMHKQKTDNAFRRLSIEEQDQYREYQADMMRKAMNSDDDENASGGSSQEVESVDSLMSSVMPVKTEQTAELSEKIKNDILWVNNRWGGKAAKDTKTGLFVSVKNKGVDNNADVRH